MSALHAHTHDGGCWVPAEDLYDLGAVPAPRGRYVSVRPGLGGLVAVVLEGDTVADVTTYSDVEPVLEIVAGGVRQTVVPSHVVVRVLADRFDGQVTATVAGLLIRKAWGSEHADLARFTLRMHWGRSSAANIAALRRRLAEYEAARN